jgi:hypothetical protein
LALAPAQQAATVVSDGLASKPLNREKIDTLLKLLFRRQLPTS